MTLITTMLVLILCLVIQFTKENITTNSIKHLENISSNPVYLIHPGEKPNMGTPFFSVLVDTKGNVLESHSDFFDLSDRTLINTLVSTSSGTAERTGVLKDYQLRFLRVDVPNGHFYVFSDISGEIATLENLTRTCIFIGVLSFFAFLGISIYLANWAVRPVDSAWKQQKQFIADASHELKTPLTVILTNSELLLSPEYDASGKAQFAANIHHMTTQMRRLVEGLLDLSRMDNHSMNTVMEKLDYTALAEHSFSLFEPLYYEAGLTCVSDFEKDIYVKGSSLHLKQVAEILFDNALKYAAPSSLIEVNLKKQGKAALFSVATRGEAISPEDLTNIFKRFYCIDQSRTESGSYGLGLSIADSIIKEHKGKIWAESSHGVNTFYIRIGLFG